MHDSRQTARGAGSPHHAAPDGAVAIGKIVRPQGLRGEVRLYPYLDTRILCADADLRRIVLRFPDGVAEERRLEGLRRHGAVAVARLAGCESIDDAERLVGAEVYVARNELLPLLNDEYLWEDIAGATIVTSDGPLGVLRDFFSTGSSLGGNDVWVVETPDGEVLLPATDEVIQEVDLEARRIVVKPIDGLLDACSQERHAH